MGLPIAILGDKNYKIPAIVMMSSVLENTKEQCDFYILHNELTDEDKNYFNDCLNKYSNFTINFTQVDDKIFQNAPLNRHFKTVVYYRLVAAELIPNVDRILYLDTDTIVNFDVKELYNIDLENKPIAAALEKCMQYDPNYMINCYYLNLDHRQYFNAGVLVIDLKYFRENNITKSFIDILNTEQDNLNCLDQDVLNLQFQNNYKKLDYKFNVLTGLKTLLKINNDPDVKAFDDIKIYHFAGEKKPWNVGIEYKDVWLNQARKVIDEKSLMEFCPSLKPVKKPQKILSVLNEAYKNIRRKNLYIFGIKIPLLKEKINERYICKYFLGIRYSKKPNPDYLKLFMTIVCKNEENIIEQQIRFHKEMGVDGFIVLNHNSDDNTLNILEKLKNEGIVAEIITKKAKEHKHHIWVEEMVKLAKEKYGASWVINADADEFYFSKSLNLKESIKNSGDVNALLINSKTLFPDNREDFFSSPYFVTKPFLRYELAYLKLDPTEVWLNESSVWCKKVIHKTDGFISIQDGNHDVEMVNKKMIAPSDICYYHYHVKNYNEYENKTKRWMDALKSTPKNMNKHLKRSLELYKKGLLKQDYENKYGANQREKLMKKGLVSVDLTVYNFLKWKGII